MISRGSPITPLTQRLWRLVLHYVCLSPEPRSRFPNCYPDHQPIMQFSWLVYAACLVGLSTAQCGKQCANAGDCLIWPCGTCNPVGGSLGTVKTNLTLDNFQDTHQCEQTLPPANWAESTVFRIRGNVLRFPGLSIGFCPFSRWVVFPILSCECKGHGNGSQKLPKYYFFCIEVFCFIFRPDKCFHWTLSYYKPMLSSQQNNVTPTGQGRCSLSRKKWLLSNYPVNTLIGPTLV